MSEPIFYFDLGSPYAYLAAERIEGLLPDVAWQPVLLGGIFKQTGRSSWSLTDRRQEGTAEVERRAKRYGLPLLCWPEPWPGNTLLVMRCATWAQQQGRVVEFAKAAFRAAFVKGLDLSLAENLVGSAEQVGLDPNAMLVGAQSDVVKQQLVDTTQQALNQNVIGVPTVVVNGEVFWGDDRLEQALVE